MCMEFHVQYLWMDISCWFAHFHPILCSTFFRCARFLASALLLSLFTFSPLLPDHCSLQVLFADEATVLPVWHILLASPIKQETKRIQANRELASPESDKWRLKCAKVVTSPFNFLGHIAGMHKQLEGLSIRKQHVWGEDCWVFKCLVCRCRLTPLRGVCRWVLLPSRSRPEVPGVPPVALT